MPKPSDLLQGTLDLLILRVIATGPLHGWGIAKRIQLVSGDVLSVGQGSLYPALHRLEQQGWIASSFLHRSFDPDEQKPNEACEAKKKNKKKREKVQDFHDVRGETREALKRTRVFRSTCESESRGWIAPHAALRNSRLDFFSNSTPATPRIVPC